MRPLRPRLLLVLLPCFAAAAAAGAESPDPWDLLRGVRSALGGAPARATFRQTYIPAGFSSGEEESGTVSLALPDCVRWDYDEPFAKSFLLCGDVAYTWNQDERFGRQYRVDPEEDPGIDLLRFELGRLMDRYTAMIGAAGEGQTTVRLAPRLPTSLLREAFIDIEDATGTPTKISYRDEEGNLTTFSFTPFTPAPDEAFARPPAIDWRQE